MKSASLCREKHQHQHFFKKDILVHYLANTASLFYLTCLTITTLFCFHLLFHQTSITFTPNKLQSDQTNTSHVTERESCDLFQGQWIPDPTGPMYTNNSCATIPFLRNCFLHGRKDGDFLHWRWKPDQCDLPRFDPGDFLSILRGKTMAFIGDSLARNQMESLLCLLSSVETPEAIEKPNATKTDILQEKFTTTTWKFRQHNFTLTAIWSQFLVAATERVVNGTATGSFHLHLDRVDTSWSEKLPLIDYAVFSDAHWFFRPNYLYEGGHLIGCVYCHEPNLTDLGPALAIRKAFRTAFKAINERGKYKDIFTLLRTYSPPHFENGEWNTGGRCNRTRPVRRGEVDKARSDWDYGKIQREEMERAREVNGSKFEVVDVTEMMTMRPDGHPGLYWGNRWMKGYSDCIHWCMPGPIDTWNELLLELIKRRVANFSN